MRKRKEEGGVESKELKRETMKEEDRKGRRENKKEIGVEKKMVQRREEKSIKVAGAKEK